MACTTCQNIKTKAKEYWEKAKTWMQKETWGVPNWALFVVAPVVLIVGGIMLLKPRKKHK